MDKQQPIIAYWQRTILANISDTISTTTEWVAIKTFKYKQNVILKIVLNIPILIIFIIQSQDWLHYSRFDKIKMFCLLVMWQYHTAMNSYEYE